MLLPILERAARVGMVVRGFRSRLIETSIGAVHVFDAEGTGPHPPVVIIHGIGSNATPYWPILKRMRSVGRRVLAPEAPGHGGSPAPTTLTPESLFIGIAELLDRVLDEPAVLFGNSLGGALSIQYALHRPERVKKLILSSPGGAQMTDDEVQALLTRFQHESDRAARAFLEDLYHEAPWYSPFIARDIRRIFSRPALQSLIASIRSEHTFPPDAVRALSMPILLLWGRSDRIMPRAHFDFYRTHLPAHALIEEPEGFGHCPYLDDPNALAARITRFIVSGE